MPLSLVPRILAFDTSTMRGSVALLEGPEVVAELRLHSPKTHSTVLLGSVEFLLSKVGWSLPELNLVAVGAGPGSFTGIRIGIATALGMAQSLSIPFVEISGLDAMAYQAAALHEHIGVVLDARRDQAFYAEYVSRNRRIRIDQKPVLVPVSELEHQLAGRHLYIVGDTGVFRRSHGQGRANAWPRIASVDPFLASAIGRLALLKKRKWRSGDYVMSEPLYIRPPDALRNKTRSR
jgi:tRNA threonylcarbamoyladenosine biosynthesis protein TsaB